jgi:hypothetical protein
MKRPSHLPCWLIGMFCLQLACQGCATQSKEPGRAVASPPSAEPTQASLAAAEQQASPTKEEAAALSDDGSLSNAPPAPAQAPAGAAAARASAKPAARAASGADAEHMRAPVTTSASKSKTARARAESASPAPPAAAPAFGEPPELRAAILEFDAQWEQLSASKACEDACRALESMRRSAQRICDLVVTSDPRQRCPTARARLDQASRDLAARCTECR